MLVEGIVGQELNRLKQKQLLTEARQTRPLDAPKVNPDGHSLRRRAGNWLIRAGCRVAGDCDRSIRARFEPSPA